MCARSLLGEVGVRSSFNLFFQNGAASSAELVRAGPRFRDGDKPRCRELLTAALGTAADGLERPALATVIDAIAVFALQAGGTAGSREQAALAATLLGAAHTIRGVFDEGSLDAPGARDAARGLLGPAAFQAAYERGLALARDEALTHASGAVAGR